jgi:23S rRNA (uracil1939-C5)-methyltransferase
MTQTNAKTELTLEIDALTYGPYGIAREQGKAVMIPNTAPGDRVAARIVESKERYAVGKVIRLLASSPVRQMPPCPYVGECGGCPWQHIRYDAQLKAKQQSVEDALRRIGKLDNFDLRPIIPSPDEYGYRRRIRLQLDSRQRLGFYHPSSHRLVEIDSCLIAFTAVNECLAALQTWAQKVHGTFEYVEIVAGDGPGEIVIVAKSAGDFILQDEAVFHGLLEQEPRIGGLVLAGGNWRKSWGETRISIFAADGIRLQVEADLFTQINPAGNRIILNELLTMANFEHNDLVLELYCGAGNFTLAIAKRVREVVAIEGHRPAVESGKLSGRLNDLSNIRWLASHVPAAVAQLAKRQERFSKIVLDPPRAGAKGIERDLAALNANKILYLSCNPTTLARDLAGLAKHGYRLTRVQPIDLFPQTFHVETVAEMMR